MQKQLLCRTIDYLKFYFHLCFTICYFSEMCISLSLSLSLFYRLRNY